MHGRHRAFVAGVHGLDHVKGLGPSTLTDDDPIGTHAEGVLDEVRRGDGTPALNVRRPRFQADDVLLLHAELGGVLDRDDPVIVLDEARKRVQQCCLARAGASGDDDVEPRLHDGLHQHQHLGGEGLEPEQVVLRQRLRPEHPDGQDRTVEGQRRDDRVDSGAVRQPGVHHRRTLVDPSTDPGDDPVDDLQEVVIIPKVDD